MGEQMEYLNDHKAPPVGAFSRQTQALAFEVRYDFWQEFANRRFPQPHAPLSLAAPRAPAT